MQEKIQKKSPIKLRILQFAETLDISMRKFYDTTGISRGTLESSSGITEDTMAKVIDTFPQISIEWLISGQGEMLRITTPTQEIENKTEDLANDKELIVFLKEQIKDQKLQINKLLDLLEKKIDEENEEDSHVASQRRAAR